NLGAEGNMYVFSIGDGSDTIEDHGSSSSYSDRIMIDTRGAELTRFRVGRDTTDADNLKINYDGGDITVLDQFSGTGRAVEYVGFNGGSYAGFNFGVR